MRKFLSEKELEKLTTPRLLNYLRSLHAYHETPHWDDERPGEMTKDNEEWKKQYSLVKSILSNREHLNG